MRLVKNRPEQLRRWWLSLLVSFGCLIGAGEILLPIAFASIFVDVAEQIGLDCPHFNGMTGAFVLAEITGSGGALFDYDNDGDLDVYCVQGALLGTSNEMSQALFPWPEKTPPQDRLYRNDLVVGPDGDRQLRFTEVTEQSGIQARGYGMGVATGDINNDGWLDLFVSNYGQNQLFQNQGDGTFVEVGQAAGIAQAQRWSTSAAFLTMTGTGGSTCM